MKLHNLQFGFQVDLVIILCLEVVFFRLAILAHHNNRCGVGGLKGKREVEQDERIWVPAVYLRGKIEREPNDQQRALKQDKPPRTNDRCKAICQPFARAQLCFELVGHIARNQPAVNETLDNLAILNRKMSQFLSENFSSGFGSVDDHGLNASLIAYL